MQFLPSTWRAYAADGNGDGRSDVRDLADASFGAARLLCANGGDKASQLSRALWLYNHSSTYVRQVLVQARRLEAAIAGAAG